MARTQPPATTEHHAPPPPSRKITKFAAPDELPDYVIVGSQAEDEIQGWVLPKNVRALLDTFGLQARTNVVFPFQHIRRAHGEIWRMRIEPAEQHMVEGENVIANRFLYVRDIPERVGAAQ